MVEQEHEMIDNMITEVVNEAEYGTFDIIDILSMYFKENADIIKENANTEIGYAIGRYADFEEQNSKLIGLYHMLKINMEKPKAYTKWKEEYRAVAHSIPKTNPLFRDYVIGGFDFFCKKEELVVERAKKNRK